MPAAAPGHRDRALTLDAGDCSLFLAGRLGDAGPGSETAARRFLAAYRERELEALETLRGFFALVLWDGGRRRLLAARDPLGRHPLFWTPVASGLLLSPTVESLLAEPEVSRELHRGVLAARLGHLWCHEEETCFRYIRRVPLGSALIVERGGRRLWRYWDPVPAARQAWLPAEATREFPDRLEAAVERSCGGDPCGIFLSGGLDSVSVAVTAARLAQQQNLPPPVALGIGFPHPDCDEQDTQRRVAAQLGMQLTLIPFASEGTDAGLLRPLLRLTSRLAAPPLNPFLPWYERLREQAVSAGCQAVLTGAGGDEWLGVSPLLAADLMRGRRWRELLAFGREMQRSVTLSAPRVWWNHLWRFGARPLLRAAWASRAPRSFEAVLRTRARRALPPWLAPDAALRAELREGGPGAGGHPAPDSFYWHEVQTSLRHPLVALEMEELFAAGQRAGLRMEAPYLEDEMVEYLIRLRPADLGLGGRSKGLARQLLTETNPELVAQRKVIFTRFFYSKLLEEGPGVWRSLEGFPALTELGVVDGGALVLELERLVQRRRLMQAHRIWDACLLEAWVRGIEGGAAEGAR